MILPFRESRIFQFHYHLLEGTDPFATNNGDEPVFIGENELDDENFVAENYQSLILLKDISKT